MLKKIIRNIFFVLCFPIRWAVRCELLNTENRQDLVPMLYRRATETTADYIIKNMVKVPSVEQGHDLLTLALGKAELAADSILCEFGVFNGASINHVAGQVSQRIFGFDSFEGLPEEWRADFGKGHFKVASLPEVKANVTLVKGWFNETLPPFIKEQPQPIAFIHIDCDLYSSTKTVFELLGRRIQPGCVIVFDEYFNYPGWQGGEFKAFQEFIQHSGLAYDYIGYNRRHEQVAVKIKAKSAA